MKNIGFNDATIALATIVFTVVLLVLNIPLGILADRWSRKNILILSSIFLSLSTLVCGLSSGPITYTVGLALWAVFLACYSGAFDSTIYDVVVEETGNSDDFEKLYGRAELYNSAAYISGALLSGLVAHWISLRAVYIVSLPFALASIVPLLYFREPTLHKKNSAEFVKSHIKQILRVFASKNQLLLLVAAMVLTASSMRILLEFGPLWLVALSLPIVFYGPIAAFTHLTMGVCGFVASWVKDRRVRIVLLTCVVALLSLLLATRSLPAIVFATALMLLGYMALNIVLSRYLHDATPSTIRVGVSSVVTTMGYIAFLPMAYAFGQVSNNSSIFYASSILIASSVISIFIVGMVVSRQKKRAGVH